MTSKRGKRGKKALELVGAVYSHHLEQVKGLAWMIHKKQAPA